MAESGPVLEGTLDLLSRADAPLTMAQIVSTLKNSAGAPGPQQASCALTELVGVGKAFLYPALRKGGKERYWHAPPIVAVTQRILRLIASGPDRITVRQAKERLLKSEKPLFDQALGTLINEKSVFILSSGQRKYLLNRAPRPSEHLTRKHTANLREILSRINRYRIAKLTMAELEGFLDGVEARSAPQPAVSRVSDQMFRKWYAEDLLKRRGATSVPIPWTWARYESWCTSNNAQVDLHYFQRRLRGLAASGVVELIAHSRTEPITDKDRYVVLAGEHGEVLYFWRWLKV